jgi:uncharacterized YccA/Bax inhibitor family protein
MFAGGLISMSPLLVLRHVMLHAQIFSGNAAAAMGTLSAAKACGVVGLLAAVASMFKPTWSPVTAPTYALCKGVAMAAMSAVLEMSYPGELWEDARLT